MAKISISANGNSTPIAFGPGEHFVGVQGTFGGGVVKLEVDLGQGYFPLFGNPAIVQASDDAHPVLGPCTIRAVLSGATSPSLTFYSVERSR